MADVYFRTGSVDNVWLPVMSGGLLLWASIMLVSWWRLKARYDEKWLEDVKISGLEDLNTDAEYEERVDSELGDTEFFYPEWKQRVKQATTLCLLSTVALRSKSQKGYEQTQSLRYLLYCLSKTE